MTPTETFIALGFEGDDLYSLTNNAPGYSEFLAECMKRVFVFAQDEHRKMAEPYVEWLPKDKQPITLNDL